MKTSILTTVAALALGGAPLAASAQTGATIYADDFAGPAHTVLNGTTPTVDNGGFGGTAGATWAATSNLTYNGNEQLNYTATGGAGTGFLPFTPQLGLVYTLTCEVFNTSDADLTSLGFVTHPTPTTANNWYDSADRGGVDNAIDWVYVNNGSSQAQGGPGASQAVLGNIGGNGIYTITLDTTTPLWNYSLTGPGGTLSATFTSNPVIGGVGFGNMFSTDGAVDGVYDTFSLTVVPEPSTWALLGIGAGALAVGVRRRLPRAGQGSVK